MTPLARVEVEWRDSTPFARIIGEVDSSNVEQIGADLRKPLTNRSHELVVDLTGTTYLDSAGINLLFALGNELARHQQVLRLVVDQATPVARIVRMTSLDKVHHTYASPEQALAQQASRDSSPDEGG